MSEGGRERGREREAKGVIESWGVGRRGVLISTCTCFANKRLEAQWSRRGGLTIETVA